MNTNHSSAGCVCGEQVHLCSQVVQFLLVYIMYVVIQLDGKAWTELTTIQIDHRQVRSLKTVPPYPWQPLAQLAS